MRFPAELPGHPATLADVLAWRAELHPDRPYITFLETGEVDGPQTTRTYRQTWARARGIAAHLVDAGLQG